MRSNPTYGPLAVDWIEANVVHGEGDKFGQPFVCTADQRAFLDRLLRYDPRTKRLIVRRAVLGRAKGYGKTEFIGAIALFFLLGPLAPTAANIPVAAASFEQADLLFSSAKVMASEGPLAPYVETYDTEILRTDGPGRMFRVAAAAGTNDGGRPTLFCADELHEWIGNKARVFLVIANSIAKRRDGLVLVISTAGSDDSELLRGLYDYGKAVEAGEIDDPGFLLDWAEADADLNPVDGPEVRRTMALQANPHAEEFDLIEHIERRWHEIPEHEWLRYFANRWVSIAEDSWLPHGAWPACRSDLGLQPGAETWVAVDMALKYDTVAVIHGQWVDGRLVTRHQAWEPAGDVVDIASVEAHLRDLHRQYRLVEVAYDPAYFQRSAEALADDGLPMVEMPQSASRMVPACAKAYEAITTRVVAHDGAPTYANQVEAAVARQAGEGWRLSKGKAKRKMDAAIALVMLVDRAMQRTVPADEYVGGFHTLDEFIDDDEWED